MRLVALDEHGDRQADLLSGASGVLRDSDPAISPDGVWVAFESFRWWGLMRRRRALGLAGALVTNRFLLWGLGSVFTAAATWTASVPYLYAADLARLEAITPVVRIATAFAGLASISCSYLAFLPPAWYRRRIADAAPAAAGLR